MAIQNLRNLTYDYEPLHGRRGLFFVGKIGSFAIITKTILREP